MNNPMFESSEKMVKELISFLKKKKLWETDTGIIFNGQKISHRGILPTEEVTQGVARWWFEGTVRQKINEGFGSKKPTIYSEAVAIMEKHGFYPEFGWAIELHIYPIPNKF